MSQSGQENYISTIERRITAFLKVCLAIGMAFIVAMALLTAAHSVGRYAFSRPIPGLVELSSCMLIIAVFLGGAYTILVKGHIAIGLVVDRFSEKKQAIIDSITYILCLLLVVLALWQSFEQANYIMKVGVEFAILGIPHFPFIYIIGVGWGLIIIAIVLMLVRFFYKVFKR